MSFIEELIVLCQCHGGREADVGMASTRAARCASSSVNTHMTRAATLWWMVVLLSSPIMSIPNSCRGVGWVRRREMGQTYQSSRLPALPPIRVASGKFVSCAGGIGCDVEGIGGNSVEKIAE